MIATIAAVAEKKVSVIAATIPGEKFPYDHYDRSNRMETGLKRYLSVICSSKK